MSNKTQENLEAYCPRCGEWVVLDHVDGIDAWIYHYNGDCLGCRANLHAYADEDSVEVYYDLD